jgi:DNA-binding transcriptional regulator YhcF (GntR family)
VGRAVRRQALPGGLPWLIVCRQIRAQLAAQVESDALQAGDRLPTVRRLAEDLGVAPGTVARAYRELEQAGVIETRGRGGSFVTGDRVMSKAKAAAAAYLAETKALGLSPTDAAALVRSLSEKSRSA